MAWKAGQGKEEEESRARQQEEKTPVREEEKKPACHGGAHHVVEQDAPYKSCTAAGTPPNTVKNKESTYRLRIECPKDVPQTYSIQGFYHPSVFSPFNNPVAQEFTLLYSTYVNCGICLPRYAERLAEDILSQFLSNDILSLGLEE
ncbi:hypothetical protein STEG23_030543, partial [Scotinomys teguina]